MAIDIETTPAPIETVTPIRPSEAIRLGCLIAPVQAFGSFSFGADGSACAMVAIALARGWDGNRDDRYLYVGVSEFAHIVAPCGCLPSSERLYRGADSIWHMNDHHRWSRERIADWLEGLGL